MKYLLFPMLLIFCLIACDDNNYGNNVMGWRKVFRNNATGETLFGEKQELINAARNGYSIRVGWGGRNPNDTIRSVEHIADAQFLTITNNEELFAQITPIIGQTPELEPDSLKKIELKEEFQWTIIMGTNGYSDRLMTDRFQDTIRGHNQRHMSTTWYVEYPLVKEKEANAKPLYKK